MRPRWRWLWPGIRVWLSFVSVICIFGCSGIAKQPTQIVHYRDDLADRVWASFSKNNLLQAEKIIETYVTEHTPQARAANEICSWGMQSPEADCSILNTVGELLFIRFLIHKESDLQQAQIICKEIQTYYFNSIVIESKGQHWRPGEACGEYIKEYKRQL